MRPDQIYIDFAIEASLNSPCLSKRGVAVWDDRGLVSIGHNFKPYPFKCDQSEYCKRQCREDAVHAEQAAIIHGESTRIRGASMLHVKTVDGVLVPSMGPSCLQCSKLILATGINWMWLFHEGGWKQYDAVRFHWESGAYIRPASGGAA